MQGLIASEVIYNFAITCIKGSLLYLYHRVFFVSRIFTITLWAVAIFVAAYSITQAFAAIFQVSHFSLPCTSLVDCGSSRHVSRFFPSSNTFI